MAWREEWVVQTFISMVLSSVPELLHPSRGPGSLRCCPFSLWECLAPVVVSFDESISKQGDGSWYGVYVAACWYIQLRKIPQVTLQGAGRLSLVLLF